MRLPASPLQAFGALLLALLVILQGLQAYDLRHVEPAFWWVGMKNPSLQVMVHGERIAELQPELSHPGVRLARSVRTDNPNYLFLELEIAADTRPGELELRFLRGTEVVLRSPYRLLARQPGSAERRGFNRQDSIYLIVPDRFANGNPANDAVAEMEEKPNRANPGGRHGGDLAGIARHLDYIHSMGFTQIWPTPVLENRQPEYSYHGYSVTDLYRVDPRMGTNEEYRALTAKAKALGIGFIQDIVPNHIGSGHWWMKDLPASDWITNNAKFTGTNHRHNTAQDAYAAQADLKGLVEGWFVSTMPDLNHRNPLLATYLAQNAIWWVEYADLSGLRVDTYPYSDKTFLAGWVNAILAEFPGLTLVGEELNDNPVMVAYWLRGHRNKDGYASPMPSMMDFPLREVLIKALNEPEGKVWGQGFVRLYESLMFDNLYPDPSALVLLEGNHDLVRVFSLLKDDLAHMKMATAFIATMPRTPQFFYGTEILIPSPLERDDGILRADFPGGWAGDTVNAFTGEGLRPDQKDFQDFMRRLLVFRRGSKALQDGRMLHFNPEQGVYVYFRLHADQKVMVILNKNEQATPLPCGRFAEGLQGLAQGKDVVTGVEYQLNEQLSVPGRSALVLELKP